MAGYPPISQLLANLGTWICSYKSTIEAENSNQALRNYDGTGEMFVYVFYCMCFIVLESVLD